MQWITATIVLHNLIIDIKGVEGTCRELEDSDTGGEDGQGADGSCDEDEDEDGDGDSLAVRKRKQLIAELL